MLNLPALTVVVASLLPVVFADAQMILSKGLSLSCPLVA